MYSSEWTYSSNYTFKDDQEKWTTIQENVQMICNMCESYYQTVYMTDDIILIVENGKKSIFQKELDFTYNLPYNKERFKPISCFPVKHHYDLELDRTIYKYTISFFERESFFVYFICDVNLTHNADKTNDIGKRDFKMEIKSENEENVTLLIDYLGWK